MLFGDLLSPYAPSSEEELLASMGRDLGGDDRAKALRCANRALGRMERFTKRKLMRRTFRTPDTLTGCTVGADLTAVTGSGFSALETLDDVVAATLITAWTRIASITSDSALTLSRKATSTGTISMTFGSAPLVTSRVSEREILIPEFPVSEVLSCGWLDSDGDVQAMNLDGARLVKSTGLYYLPNDVFPAGVANISVECIAGFAAPTGSSLGDPEVSDLQEVFHRLTHIVFEDETKNRGRASQRSIGPANSNLPDFDMPRDIKDKLRSYMRRW